MELRDYVKIVRQNAIVFWATVIIITLLVAGFIGTRPKSYLASSTLTVNKSTAVKQTQANYYLYDNYYNVQSSGLFSQIVTSWFASPAVVKQIYEKAGLTVPDISQRKIGKLFRAVRVEPATINVSVTGTNKDEVTKLINAASSVMQENTNELGRIDKENTYDIVTFSPIISDNSPNLALIIVVTLIISILLGVVLTLAIDYFRRTS